MKCSPWQVRRAVPQKEAARIRGSLLALCLDTTWCHSRYIFTLRSIVSCCKPIHFRFATGYVFGRNFSASLIYLVYFGLYKIN